MRKKGKFECQRVQVEKYNPYHYPKGTGKGGQFAPKGAAGGAGGDLVEVPYRGTRVHQKLVEQGLAAPWKSKPIEKIPVGSHEWNLKAWAEHPGMKKKIEIETAAKGKLTGYLAKLPNYGVDVVVANINRGDPSPGNHWATYELTTGIRLPTRESVPGSERPFWETRAGAIREAERYLLDRKKTPRQLKDAIESKAQLNPSVKQIMEKRAIDAQNEYVRRMNLPTGGYNSIRLRKLPEEIKTHWEHYRQAS